MFPSPRYSSVSLFFCVTFSPLCYLSLLHLSIFLLSPLFFFSVVCKSILSECLRCLSISLYPLGLSVCLYVSLTLSVSLSVSFCIYLNVSVCLSIYLSHSFSTSFSPSPACLILLIDSEGSSLTRYIRPIVWDWTSCR